MPRTPRPTAPRRDPLSPENLRATLELRTRHAADYVARDLGYRITGLRAFDAITDSRAAAWYQLTRGSVVLTVDGMETATAWVPTLDEAKPAYEEMRAAARRVDPVVSEQTATN